MVTFKEDSHTYFNEDGVIYTSATTIVGAVKQPFLKEYWSLYKGLQKALNVEKNHTFSWMLGKKGFDKSMKDESEVKRIAKIMKVSETFLLKCQSAILAEWDKKSLASTDKGTKIHKEKEDKFFSDGFGVFDENISGVTRKADTFDLYSLEDGFYPEMLLWNDENEIAGLADKIWLTTENGIRYADISDWKSNKEIKTTGFEFMLEPVSHLQCCHFSHYSLQLSIYLWMLEQFGFVPRKSRFIHVPDGTTETIYETPYLKKEVEDILYYKRMNLLNFSKH